MSYLINNTDGTLLTEIVDGTLDQLSTSLTLIGKNASSYGESLNENFVRLLENFSSGAAPANPIRGQLWFDINESRLKVYDGTAFKLSGSTIVSDSMPSSIARGDLWIDSRNKQLYFNDGVSNTLAGPINSPNNGVAVEAVLDQEGLAHNIIIISISPISGSIVDSVTVGIISADTFNLKDPIGGDGGFQNIRAGFNFLTPKFATLSNIIDPEQDADAVNLRSLNNKLKLAPLTITLNITDPTDILERLEVIFPAADYAVDNNGPICKVISPDGLTIKSFMLVNSGWQYQPQL